MGAGAAGARLPALGGVVNILRDAAQVGGSSFMRVRNPDGIDKAPALLCGAPTVSAASATVAVAVTVFHR